MKNHSPHKADENPASFEDAFSRLFPEHFPSLFRYLHRLSGDADLAEDLAQEVFVKLYRRGSLPDDLRGWVGAVAHNLLRDHRRTGKRRLRLLETRQDAPDFERTSPAADEKVIMDERRTAVRRALEKLAERDRRMLLLRHEGYSYREIARAIGVNETSVGTLLLRATAAFHTALGDTAS